MSIRRKIVFALAYLFILTLFVEGISRLAFSIDPVFEKIAGVDESSWRLSWIKRHQGEVEIYYKFDIYDPAKGWVPRPNLRDEAVFDGKILNTNSRGLRGAEEYSYERTPGRTRILILGDSFTFGDEVSDNETYSYYLRKMIPDSEIINMGVHGYGHDQMLIYLKEEGIKYKPDIVILGFVYEDIQRNTLGFRDFAKPEFEVRNGELLLTNTPVPSPEQILKWEWARPKTYDLLRIFCNRLLHNRFTYRYGLFEGKTKEVTGRILDEMVELIGSIDAVPVFVYLPVRDEIEDPDEIIRGEAYLYEYCTKNGKVKCFSARPYFTRKIRQGETFSLTGHWSPLGHLTVAEAIYDFMVEGEMLEGSGPD